VVAAARGWGCGARSWCLTLSGVQGTPAQQPLHVATDWAAAGAVPLGALLATVAVAAFFYWRMLARTDALPLPIVLALSAAGLAIAWCAPVLFSSDVYAYAAYGEMARIGLNPYFPAPVPASDVVVRAAQLQWGNAFPICVYGPAFVGVARAIVTLVAPFGQLAQLQAFRVTACVAFLFCVVLAYAAYRGDRTARLRAAATIGLNPVAIWSVAEGHNDAIALLGVLAGFVLLRRGFFNVGAAVVALSGLIKPPGIAAAIALAAVERRARIGAILGVIIVLGLSFPLAAGIATQLAPHGTYAPQASLQAIVAPISPAAARGLALAVSALIAMRAVALLRRRETTGWIWLGLAAWVLLPNPYPWYALWLLALAALTPATLPAGVAILLSFSSLLRYVPDVIGTPSAPVAAALGIVATLPLLLVPFRRILSRAESSGSG
jgi:hypothetical protein